MNEHSGDSRIRSPLSAQMAGPDLPSSNGFGRFFDEATSHLICVQANAEQNCKFGAAFGVVHLDKSTALIFAGDPRGAAMALSCDQ